MTNLEKQISHIWHNAKVENVVIDEEFGNVTATVNGMTYTDCGFLEDYTDQ